MAITDPRVEIQERSGEPCDFCGMAEGVLTVTIDILKPKAGTYEGFLCWDCLRRAYEDPALLCEQGQLGVFF